MKYILTVFAFLFFSSTSFSQGNFQHQKDSLRLIITKLEGEEKLVAYLPLLYLNYPESEIDTLFNYCSAFIAECSRQGNKEKEQLARERQLAFLANYNQTDEFYKKAHEHMLFFRKNGFMDTYYKTYRYLLETYIENGENNKAMNEAEKFRTQAQKDKNIYGMSASTYIIARIYTDMENEHESEKYYREALSLLKNSQDKNLRLLKFETYGRLCPILHHKKEFDEVVAIMFEWRNNIVKMESEGIVHGTIWHAYYHQQALYCLEKDDYNNAELYCDSIEMKLQDPRVYPTLYRYRSIVYENRKQYDKALEYIDKAHESILALGNLNYSINILSDKGRILSKAGRGIEAYPVYESAIELSDSLRNERTNMQLNELRTVYELDKHIAEKERNRHYFLFALIGCVLLVIALGIWIYYSRKISKKNRTLVSQIKELQEQHEKEEAELLGKTTFEMEDDLDDNLCPESRKNELCITIRDIILKDKAYRDPTLTRDLLVERLATNKNTFIEAFQYCFGMPFPEFINNLRLKDAITLLGDSDLSMDEISQKVGFGSLRTFQRQFQNKYNMTPKEYRKSFTK